jgi:hypothetical protein
MNKQYPELITNNGGERRTVVTRRHTTECSLVQEAQNLPPYCPLKVTGTQAATRIIIPKSSNFFCRVCVGLELPGISLPPPATTLHNSFAFCTHCLRHYESDPFCEFRTNHMRSIHFTAPLVFTVYSRSTSEFTAWFLRPLVVES